MQTLRISAIVLAIAIFGLIIGASTTQAARGTSTPPVISSFTATPSSASAGQNVTLKWSVSNATKLTIEPGVGTVYKTSKVVTPTTTTTYILSAVNSAGTTTASTTVTVGQPKPTCQLSVSPSSIVTGSSTTLTFSSSNALSGTISPDIGTVATSGQRVITPTVSTTYTGTFTGQNGSATCTTKVTVTQPVSSGETKFTAYLTSYSYWDNTPPGSSLIAYPVIHTVAGGTGTYNDPITIAVGHSIVNAVDILDFPKGTKFYVPNVRRYFIVEDSCGDGATPQNGPCHTGYPAGTSAWLDMWLDGQNGSTTTVNKCASLLTGAHTMIQNPAANYVVVSGALYGINGCSAQFGETVVSI